jgi:pimeloyl-ACP methyl ester carboxylesterase
MKLFKSRKKNHIIQILILITTLALGSLSLASEEQNKVVVLVPGFFNSFAPEYFSQEIVESFENKGFKVYVIQNLNPIGTIAENGLKLEQNLIKIEESLKAPTSFHLVGHSAGGFYSLFVANRNKLKIASILTVSTPFKGVEFIEKWLQNSLLFNALTKLVRLDGLKEMTPKGIQKFIQSIRVSPDTKLIAFGGYQPKSIDIWDARNISLPLRVTSSYISEESDGIVGYSSALGFGSIMTTENKTAIQLKDPNYFLDLEHWEQVLSSRSFLFLAIRNTDYIRREQIRFYGGLADLLTQMP